MSVGLLPWSEENIVMIDDHNLVSMVRWVLDGMLWKDAYDQEKQNVRKHCIGSVIKSGIG